MTVTGQAWNVLRWLPGWQMTDVPARTAASLAMRSSTRERTCGSGASVSLRQRRPGGDGLAAQARRRPGAGNRSRAPGQHPRGAEWERACGRPVPGRDCAAQLAALSRWHDREQHDQAAVSAVIWGTRQRTAIEQAVGASASADSWEDQLTTRSPRSAHCAGRPPTCAPPRRQESPLHERYREPTRQPRLRRA